MLLKLLITILILPSLIKTEPSADLIKEAREKIARINVSFLVNNSPEISFVNELDNLLSELKVINIIANSVLDEKDFQIKSDQLIKSFKAFEQFYRDEPEVDTLKKVFRVVNNEFNSLYGKYFLDELKKTANQKVILFSTSMSCECTLEMCYKQEAEIQKLQLENPGLYDYAVVDCFTSSDLQTEYQVGFIPVVLILDSNNKEVKRFVREENLYSELNKYLLDK